MKVKAGMAKQHGERPDAVRLDDPGARLGDPAEGGPPQQHGGFAVAALGGVAPRVQQPGGAGRERLLAARQLHAECEGPNEPPSRICHC